MKVHNVSKFEVKIKIFVITFVQTYVIKCRLFKGGLKLFSYLVYANQYFQTEEKKKKFCLKKFSLNISLTYEEANKLSNWPQERYKHFLLLKLPHHLGYKT